jgi:hypothetical protein
MLIRDFNKIEYYKSKGLRTSLRSGQRKRRL